MEVPLIDNFKSPPLYEVAQLGATIEYYATQFPHYLYFFTQNFAVMIISTMEKLKLRGSVLLCHMARYESNGQICKFKPSYNQCFTLSLLSNTLRGTRMCLIKCPRVETNIYVLQGCR